MLHAPTALHDAIYRAFDNDDADVLGRLLDDGLAPDARIPHPFGHYLLLDCALQRRAEQCALLLLERGAPLQTEYRIYGWNDRPHLLIGAMWSDKIMATLIARRIPWPEQPISRRAVFQACAACGSVATMHRLLGNFFARDLDAADPCDWLLDGAAGRWRADLLQAMAALGFNLGNIDADGENLLHMAAIRREFDRVGTEEEMHATVALLIAHGANINQVSESGGTPAIEAIFMRDHRALDVLLQHGADLTIGRWNKAMTPLAMIAHCADRASLAVAHRHGIDLRQTDGDRKTLLHWAATAQDASDRIEGFIEDWGGTVALLTAAGIDIDARDVSGKTPLLTAFATGRLDIMLPLLEAGADPLAACRAGRDAGKTARRAVALHRITQEQADAMICHLHAWNARQAMRNALRLPQLA